MVISLKDLFVLSIQQMMGMWSACRLWDSRENSKTFQLLKNQSMIWFAKEKMASTIMFQKIWISPLVPMFLRLLPRKMTFSSHKENEMVVGLQFLVLKKMRKVHILFN